MRKEEINISVDLDNNNICERILWDASNTPEEGTSEAKGMLLALWDDGGRGTAKIDLWTKEMDIFEMKRFIIETISGMADTVRQATDDDLMATELEILCQQLSKRLEKEIQAGQ
jgi:gliding motility-associated protein GldC